MSLRSTPAVATTSIRVWDADTGAEQTVNIASSAGEYLKVSDPKNLKHLTINDYTLAV